MSGVGFWELVILLLIGLIVLGPERLPRVANQLGTWLGQARRMTRMMKRQLEEELNLEKDPGIRPARLSAPPPAQRPPEPRREYDDTYSPAHPAGGVGSDVRDPGMRDGEVAADEEATEERREERGGASPDAPSGDDAATRKTQ